LKNTVSIGDLVQLRDDTADPTSPTYSGFTYIGLDAVAPGTGTLLFSRSSRDQRIRSRSKRFHAGDILYARLRANLNKVILIPSSLGQGLCSGEFYVLIPDEKRVLPEFLRWLLSAEAMVQYVALRLAGATHPRLALEDLLQYRVRLPSLARQGRAVEVIRSIEQQRSSLKDELLRLDAEASAKIAEAAYPS
jgi:type I restriction enzyme S subunit